jgi:uncharacterized protein (DUF302 family)
MTWKIANRFLALLLLATALSCLADPSPFVSYKSSLPFEQVMEDLQMAIADKGFHINKIMHLDRMWERNRKEGETSRPTFLHAKSIDFCSSVLSRRMTEEDPQRIVNCPFVISVYVLAAEPEITHITHRRVTFGDDSAATREAAAMLKSLGEVAQKGYLNSEMEDF